MKLTENGLRRIIREELNEMRKPNPPTISRKEIHDLRDELEGYGIESRVDDRGVLRVGLGSRPNNYVDDLRHEGGQYEAELFGQNIYAQSIFGLASEIARVIKQNRMI